MNSSLKETHSPGLHLKSPRKRFHLDKCAEFSPGFQAPAPAPAFQDITHCFPTLPHCTPLLPPYSFCFLLPPPPPWVSSGGLCTAAPPRNPTSSRASLPWKNSRHPIRSFTSRTITSPSRELRPKHFHLCGPSRGFSKGSAPTKPRLLDSQSLTGSQS